MVIGFWSIVVLGALVALGWFGWRTLFRIAEKNFWALNSIGCEPPSRVTLCVCGDRRAGADLIGEAISPTNRERPDLQARYASMCDVAI